MTRLFWLGTPGRIPSISASAGFALLLSLLLSCGKETKTNNPVDPPIIEEINSDMEQLLARQTVGCAEGTSCPEGIAKIAIVDKNRLRFCTGFLVNAVTVATSASCLTETLRISTDERVCQRDVHVYFAQAGFRREARVACKRLLHVSPLEGRDPALWRSDLSYIEIEERPEVTRRRVFRMSREGIENNESLTLWRVDSESGDAGIIRRGQCRGVLGSYANPLSTNQFDPGAVISGCDFRPSTQGAPLVNSQGKWVGIFSRPVNVSLIDFLNTSGLLIEPLRPMAHISNAACLLALVDSDPVVRQNCSRSLTTSQYDQAMAAMLRDPSPHEAQREAIRRLANESRAYFKWRVDLIADGNNGFTVKLVPVCMNPINTWIRRMGNPTFESFRYAIELPATRFVIGFDHAARIVSRPVDEGAQRVFVRFSPRSAARERQTSVQVSLNGSFDDRYPQITETCQE
jgi:hypothetical protein